MRAHSTRVGDTLLANVPHRFGFLARSALAAVLLTGCTGVHLYREADYTIAVKAQSAFAEAKIGEGLVAERSRLENLVKSELEGVRRFALARRDESLVAFVAGTDQKSSWGAFDDETGIRLVTLLGNKAQTMAPSPDQLNKALNAATDIRLATAAARLAEEDMALARDAYRLVFVSAHPTDDPPELACPLEKDPPSDSGLDVALKAFREACQDYLKARQTIENAGDAAGLWRSLNNEIHSYEDARAKVNARVRELKEQYEQAKKEYQAATKPEDITGKAKALKEKLDGVGKIDVKDIPPQLQSLKLLGLVEALQTQRQSIGNLLDAVAQGAAGKQAPGKDVDLQVVSTIAGAAAAMEEALRVPNIGVLLLEAQRLELELDAARGALAIEEGRLVLLKRKRAAMASEIDLLRDARLQIGEATCRKSALVADFKAEAAGSKCREKISFALLDYADSWSQGRMVEEQVDWLLLALRHAAALDSAEVALRQWQNLVEVPVGRLVAYHAAGVKTETIISVINSALLVWIGAAVQ